MAKRIVDEEMHFDVIINGNTAQKELYDLEKSTRKLTEENKALGLQKKQLERQNKQDTEDYKALTRTIKENNAEIKQNKTRMQELQKQIGLNGLTMGQLTKEASRLRLMLRNMVPGSADYQKYEAELKKVSARISEVSGKAKSAKSSLSTLADGFNKYAALAASFIAMATGVVVSLQKMIDYNGKLSDAQADVMKTTGMTKKEVDELTRSFGLLKTRTSRIDLLGIAEQGGRIGIAKNEIQDFVQAMDKASVALGDSFTGGAEEVAEKLGKIKFLFQETKDMGVEQAYMSIGSAINELGANGVASERNIAEFTQRMGSLTDVLKPTVSETLALGAAFEESGVEAEVSSRAYNIFMKQAATNAGKFAKVMGTTKKAVEDMINTNPLDFMLKFSEGMRGMDATDVAKTLDYLGVNADGANKAIGAMANNTDRFRQLIDLSNQSFKEGTSLIDEYNIKNNNLGATLEKLKKTMMGWFSSEGLVAWLTSAVNWFSKFVGATEDADGSVTAWRNTLAFVVKSLAVVVAALVTANTWTKLVALTTKEAWEASKLYKLALRAQSIEQGIAAAGGRALAIVGNLIRLNFRGAWIEFKALSLAMKTTPWGLVLALITAGVTAFIAFRDSADEAAKSQSQFTKQQEELSKKVAAANSETKTSIISLINVIKDEKVSLDSRKKAYDELVKISPIFNGYLVDEKFNVEGLLKVYSKYLEMLDQVAYAKAFNALNDENIQKQIDAQKEVYLAEKELANARQKLQDEQTKTAGQNLDKRNWAQYRQLVADKENAKQRYDIAVQAEKDANKLVEDTNSFRQKRIEELENAILMDKHKINDLESEYGVEASKKMEKYKLLIAQLEADQKTLDALQPKANVPDDSDPDKNKSGSHYNIPDATGEKAADKQKKLAEKALEELKKQGDEVNKLQHQIIDERLGLIEDGLDKEEALEAERHRRAIEQLKEQMVSEAEIQKANDIINDPKSSPKVIDTWTKIKETWVKRNKALNELIEIEEGRHEIALETLSEKGEEKRLNDLQRAFDLETEARETAHNEAMAALGDDEIAKKKLQDKFDKDELDRRIAFLKQILAEKEKILNDQNANVDIDFLSPEQKKKLEDDAAALKKIISELQLEEEKLNNKKSDSQIAFTNVFGGADILGFSAKQWEETFNHLTTMQQKLEAVKFTMATLQNAWAQYDAFMKATEDAQMAKYEDDSERKKKKLKWELDNGYINKADYNHKLELLDKNLDKKKAELEYKQAKRQKEMALFNAIIGTAQAVVAAANTNPFFPLGVIMMGLAAASGALQIATIQKQPLPARGYETGLYPDEVKREQDGKMFRARYGGKTKSGLVNRPTYFLTGENGPEMIIDAKAYRQMSPETKDLLVRELRGIKGFEQGYYNNKLQQPRLEVPSVPSGATAADSGSREEMLMRVIERNSDILEKVYNDGMVAFFSRDPRELKSLMDEMDRIKASKQKALN